MKIEGIDVEDGDETITIRITKRDVRFGALKTSRACAAARALCRQGDCEAARVHISRAYIKQGGTWKRYQVPPALRTEIVAFDRGGHFEPGEYKLAPMSPALRLENQSKPRPPVGAKTRKRSSKAGRSYHMVSGVRDRMMADWE